MKRLQFYKWVIGLVVAVVLTALTVDLAESSRRRRVKCNSTGTVIVSFKTGYPRNMTSQIAALEKTFQYGYGGTCGVRSGRCKYVGPSAQSLFNNWKGRYPDHANRLRNYVATPNWKTNHNNWAQIDIKCRCQGSTYTLSTRSLKASGSNLILD